MSDARRLIEIWNRLGARERASLLDYASFLAQRAAPPGAVSAASVPPNESVVQAIRRLNRSYPALRRHALAQRVEMLLAQHMMDDRPAADVIADLERHYAEQHARLEP